MSNRAYFEEKNFRNSLIAALSNWEETPTREMVEAAARGLALVARYQGDIQNAISETLVAIETRMGVGVSLIDTSSQALHDDQWVQSREDS